ncbi:MAG TPA: Cro/CI family transcriptional regulator [Acidocella sp.]|nr:Cro/CI family transcriptional regulator [Acidocella sp.]
MARRPKSEWRPTQKERREIVERAPTVRDVIEAFGGVKGVADTVGVAHPSVCQWVRENRIPQGRISELARHYRVTRAALTRFVMFR